MAQYLNGYKVVKRHAFTTKLTAILLLIFAAIPVGSVFLPIFSANDPSNLFGLGGGTDMTISFNAITVVKALLAKMGVITLESGDVWINSFILDVPTPDFGNIANWMIIAESIVMVIIAVFSIIMFFMSFAWLFKAGHEYYSSPMKMAIIAGILDIAYYGVGIFGMIMYGQQYQIADSSAEVTVDIMWPTIFAGASLLLMVFIIVVFVASFKGKYFVDDVQKLTTPQENTKVMMPNITVNVSSNGEKYTTNAKVGDAETTTVSEPMKKVTVNRPMGSEMLPNNLTSIGGHAFSNNHSLINATIPTGVPSIGPGAFANCSKLAMVTIPTTVIEIGYNAFFNCTALERINYLGTKEQWSKIKRGSNWLTKAKTNIVICQDGKIIVNPLK